MKVIRYLALKIRLLFIRIRVYAAKKRVLSGVQNSRSTTANMDRCYRHFLDLSAKREEIAVSLRRITRKNTNCPILAVRVDTGTVSVSSKAKEWLPDFDREVALTRHRNGDWGEPTAQNWKANNRAVCAGRGKLLSRYLSYDGGFFLIETDLRIPRTNIRLERECV